jgi:hypothetical protein
LFAGAGDAPNPPGAIAYHDEFRTAFLQDYLEVLHASIRCVVCLISISIET